MPSADKSARKGRSLERRLPPPPPLAETSLVGSKHLLLISTSQNKTQPVVEKHGQRPTRTLGAQTVALHQTCSVLTAYDSESLSFLELCFYVV